MWKKFYKVQQGELVVQSLPSGNIMDLTGALLTPVKTLCYFDTKDGGNDMVYLGTSTITPNHHIHMAEGWMTASQAVDKGQGVVHSSKLERVYNFCLEGGGNILINTSNQPEVMIFTSAATMGYLFTPEQYGSLSYPEEIQTQLKMRQDLSYGFAHFRHGAVETLPNGGLIFENATGDMPQKKARTPLRDKSLGDNRLKQSAPQSSTSLSTIQTSGATALSSREEPFLAPSDASSLCSLLTGINGAPACLTQGTSQPMSTTANSTQKLAPRFATANTIPQSQNNHHLVTIAPLHPTAKTQPSQAAGQEYRLTPSFTSDTHILLVTAGGARWTQIRDAWCGATVIQSLSSGNVEALIGAKLATLERVWYFEEGGDDMVQIGNAYLTADHPILTDKGWLLASQAAAKGSGQPPSVREFSPLCGLQLTTGGNILINTSTTQDLASVFIEVATLGVPLFVISRTP